MRRINPITIIALVLVFAGLVSMMRGRIASDPKPQPCDPAVDEACVPPPPSYQPGTLDPRPQPGSRPELQASSACRNVGYLCSGLERSERIRIQRWRDFDGTVVVHVPLPDLPDRGLAQRLQRAATAGIRLWNGQPFPILVDERGTREAHFSVRWVGSAGGANIGVARTRWSPQTGLQVVSLELVTQHPYRDGGIDPRQLRLTAAHEMGHALGLPHSDQPRDVMYPTNTATSLSARDYRTLEALYDLEDGTVIVGSPPG